MFENNRLCVFDHARPRGPDVIPRQQIEVYMSAKYEHACLPREMTHHFKKTL